jgi:hypothetical protein
MGEGQHTQYYLTSAPRISDPMALLYYVHHEIAMRKHYAFGHIGCA